MMLIKIINSLSTIFILTMKTCYIKYYSLDINGDSHVF